MGVFDKAKGLISTPLADEPVRAVDNKRARLPTWEPDQPEEKPKATAKARPKKTKSTSQNTKKNTKAKATSGNPKPKSPPRAIANFSTWNDDAEVGAPHSVRVTPERKATMTESELAALEDDPIVDDPELEEEVTETPSLESLEAWDPYTADEEDELDEVMNSSHVNAPAETPQSTDDEPALTDYALPEDQSYVEDDTTETMSPEMNATPTDVDLPQVPTPEVTLDELPQRDATETREEVVARFTAGETLDLKRAISLEALDNLAIPDEANGYNKANVDAMMSFLRLSLDLYVRRVKQLEGLTENLAEEHSELSKDYAQLREVAGTMISVEDFAREREAREDLEAAVMELSAAAGVDSSKYLAPKEEEFVLTFSSKAKASKGEAAGVDSEDDSEDSLSLSNSNNDPADDDSEDLLWGGRLR